MLAIFINQYWHNVREDMTREVKKVLNGGAMPEGMDETMVVLIPNVPNPDKVKILDPSACAMWSTYY